MNNPLLLLRALKGAPLSTFVALAILHRPVGVMQISDATGYYKTAVSQALRVLADLGLACQVARFNAWQLTDQGQQLPMWPAQLGETLKVEGAKITLDSGSSSSLIDTEAFHSQPQEPLPLHNEGAKITLDPDLADLLAGCPPARSAPVVQAKLDAGWSVTQVERFLSWWILYVESPLGSSIHCSPAQFAITKLERDEPCPPFLHRRNDYDAHTGEAWRRWSNTNESWLRQLSADTDTPNVQQ
jgi:hypothetical protein